MRNLLTLALLVSILSFSSCGDDKTPSDTPGSLTLSFDNIVGDNQVILAEEGITEYPHTTLGQQDFNIVLLRYYVSQVTLEGSNGVAYVDPLAVGPDPDDVEGIYLVTERQTVSHNIEIANIPAGTYSKISFLIGVDSTGIQEGAAGGILDPAADAWFWNWNAGYVALGIEGQAPEATGDPAARTMLPDNPNSFGYHVGGWKDVPGSMFVYNNKVVTFNLSEQLTIGNGSNPTANITLDVQKLIEGIDFAEASALHSPLAGSPVSENIPNAFELESIEQ
ncbi:MAG: hypothetical protein NXI20_17610 [bacterium]|nr:hypothetical protein [bacterium]